MAEQFAIVTGASSGIGYQLARCAAERGHDLLVVADEPLIEGAAEDFRGRGVAVRAVQADLATLDGVDTLLAAAEGRPIDIMCANAGVGVGGAFLHQDISAWRHVVDTNITGTLYLLQRVLRQMVERGRGRVLVTGSIAGYVPGPFNAVYNGTKAFLDNFTAALRNEFKDADGVTLTTLMPGATDTEFFARAGMEDTEVGTAKKADPADVARQGWDAMMEGESHIVTGMMNKLRVAAAGVAPDSVMAEQHRNMAEPGSGEH